MLRVLHVIPAIAARYGGPSAAVIGLCRALVASGAQSEIVTTDADGPDRLHVPIGSPVDVAGVRTTYLHSWPPDSLKPTPALSPWLDARIAEWDLVHVHSVFGHPCLAAGRAARRAGVPYIVRPLGHLARWSLAQKPLRKQAFWALGGRRLVQAAAALHFTSNREMEDARSLVPGLQGFVVPLGVDIPAGRADATASGFRATVHGLGDRPYILFLGRIHEKKGLGALIEGLAATSGEAAADRWALVIAGDGEPGYLRAVQQRARRDLEGRTFWVGWLDGERKVAAMREAGLFALVSHQENFGISAFESMASGTPVLVGTGVDLSDEIERAGAGWRVTPEGPAVAGALRTILPDEKERRRRGEAASRLLRERYSWPAVAQALIGEYGRILERSLSAVRAKSGALADP